SLNPEVPPQLNDLILRLMSQEVDERFASMREVVGVLLSLEQAHTGPGLPATPERPSLSPLLDPVAFVTGFGEPGSRSNWLGMRLVLVRQGWFLMGSPEEEKERGNVEAQHVVRITRAFYLGVHQVTQGQWMAVMGSNPSHFSATGGRRSKVIGIDTTAFPVENVSWHDAHEFLSKLTALTSEQGDEGQYRLPTEAEWECACRGGPTSSSHPIHTDEPGTSLSSEQANFDGAFPY